MKTKLKILTLLICIASLSMQAAEKRKELQTNPSLVTLPKDIISEIMKWSLDTNAKDPQAYCTPIDSLRLTDKQTKQKIDEYIQSYLHEKNITFTDATNTYKKYRKYISVPLYTSIIQPQLISAILYDDIKTVKTLLPQTDPNIPGENKTGLYPGCTKFSPLEGAFTRHNPEIIRLLLAARANVNEKSGDNHYLIEVTNTTSIVEKRLEILKALLASKNININVQNSEKETPLFIFTKFLDPDAVQLLLDAGADPNIPDKNTVTPLQEAQRLINFYRAQPFTNAVIVLDNGSYHYPDTVQQLEYSKKHIRSLEKIIELIKQKTKEQRLRSNQRDCKF